MRGNRHQSHTRRLRPQPPRSYKHRHRRIDENHTAGREKSELRAHVEYHKRIDHHHEQRRDEQPRLRIVIGAEQQPHEKHKTHYRRAQDGRPAAGRGIIEHKQRRQHDETRHGPPLPYKTNEQERPQHNHHIHAGNNKYVSEPGAPEFLVKRGVHFLRAPEHHLAENLIVRRGHIPVQNRPEPVPYLFARSHQKMPALLARPLARAPFSEAHRRRNAPHPVKRLLVRLHPAHGFQSALEQPPLAHTRRTSGVVRIPQAYQARHPDRVAVFAGDRINIQHNRHASVFRLGCARNRSPDAMKLPPSACLFHINRQRRILKDLTIDSIQKPRRKQRRNKNRRQKQPVIFSEKNRGGGKRGRSRPGRPQMRAKHPTA